MRYTPFTGYISAGTFSIYLATFAVVMAIAFVFAQLFEAPRSSIKLYLRGMFSDRHKTQVVQAVSVSEPEAMSQNVQPANRQVTLAPLSSLELD
ncbi:hypothetical protein [Mesorhizobium sp.]|uniref:hypothetical protein n=1 Tax=Mesorhizobium sp. TaxID=1871066 RepID=UPI000FE8FBBE|nr:hypothetical protein [Mesorhizobium sp.]RWK62308.1 MAG: hypothetical protein EOR49_14150 [Mesorhizobium sp.]RWM49016.1 MAG: hypothetical protein EOR76_11670 [Mesorhizobium sp.]RWM54390.1 MAG: hypothetical protein EOR78_17505 [Mesorhizobium sp.]RWM61613.1 MAG: hypothetical protein EOR79_04525 [Mesorhizobium sp.]RWN03001.1 MAG: hypothetical protein EOR85_11700 [Mesorhizobium sp.]